MRRLGPEDLSKTIGQTQTPLHQKISQELHQHKKIFHQNCARTAKSNGNDGHAENLRPKTLRPAS